MDLGNLFSQVLDMAKDQLGQSSQTNQTQGNTQQAQSNGALGGLGDLLGSLTGGKGNLDLGSVLNNGLESLKNLDTTTKVGGGAALAGILSMVLGRSGGSSLAKLGSLAVLGNLAYQAYQSYQQNQNNQVSDPAENLTLDSFENTKTQDTQNEVILRAMIAAATSDGEVTEEEKQVILNENQSPEVQQWLIQEVQNPASVQEIAQLVGNDQALAAKVYLAARIVCQDLSRKEIVFLSQLADALKLDEQLVEQLEKQAGF